MIYLTLADSDNTTRNLVKQFGSFSYGKRYLRVDKVEQANFAVWYLVDDDNRIRPVRLEDITKHFLYSEEVQVEPKEEPVVRRGRPKKPEE